MFVNRGGIKADDAIREALAGGVWMTRDALVEATGFSRGTMTRRTQEMVNRDELRERKRPIESGGLVKEYRLTLPGEEPETNERWNPRELDEALGGLTFAPPGLKHPKPRFRHRVLY